MKNLQEFIFFLKPSSYQDNELDNNLEDEDNLDNEVYLWYEDFLEDKDNLDNEVFCDTKASLKMKTILTTKSFVIRRLRWQQRQSWQWSLLWYEGFVEDEDVLVNEVYLWYEDFFW